MRSRSAAVLFFALVAIVSVALPVSCFSATAVQLSIDTDVSCDMVRVHGVSIYVSGDRDPLHTTQAVAVTHDCSPSADGAQVGTLSVVPSGDRSDSIYIDVVLGLGGQTESCASSITDCVIAKRAAHYVEHHTVHLPIRLSKQCANVTCDPTDTCDKGACVPLESCGDEGCRAGTPDAALTDVVDAAVPDVVVDAPVEPPRLVASGITLPTELAIAGSDLYVTSDAPDGGIFTCPIGNCTAPTAIVSRLTPPTAIAADATNLYYSAANVALRVCDRPSCTATRLLNDDNFSAIAIDSTSLVTVALFNAYGLRIAKADGGTTYMTAQGPVAVAIDSSSAYFYIDSGLVHGVQKCPFTGCIPVNGDPQLATPGPSDSEVSMAVDATHVYWTEATNNRVMRATKDLGGAAEVVAMNVKHPRAVAVSGGFVYWTEEGDTDDDGRVVSAVATTNAPLVIASGQHRPYRLAVAAGRLYWTNRVTAGTVQFVPLR
jgi:hypothetical protein